MGRLFGIIKFILPGSKSDLSRGAIGRQRDIILSGDNIAVGHNFSPSLPAISRRSNGLIGFSLAGPL